MVHLVSNSVSILSARVGQLANVVTRLDPCQPMCGQPHHAGQVMDINGEAIEVGGNLEPKAIAPEPAVAQVGCASIMELESKLVNGDLTNWPEHGRPETLKNQSKAGGNVWLTPSFCGLCSA